MKIFGKKPCNTAADDVSGSEVLHKTRQAGLPAFTLSEVLVVLGLIGTISAITIPNIAYNYKAKVLEQQYRSTYSDLKEIGSYINYDKGDVGTYANSIYSSYDSKLKTNVGWDKVFMSYINGGNILETSMSSSKIPDYLRAIYKSAGTMQGPYRFNINEDGSLKSGIVCNNWNIWSDSKGRIWTFNSESRIICVDINGTANPNRYNIDIFAFIPMSAAQVAEWVYDDADNPNDYSGQIVPCDADLIIQNGSSNKQVSSYPNKGDGSALDACPFFEPIENIAAINSSKPGKSARNKTVDINNNYWKDYINYK